MSKKLQALVDSDSRLESWELDYGCGDYRRSGPFAYSRQRTYTISCDEGYIFNLYHGGSYTVEFDTVKEALDFFSKNPNIIITEQEWRESRKK